MKEFNRLVEIMSILRAPGGCPWDRSQKREDLKTYLVEETYEVVEAIDEKNPDKLKEELGDLLLQIIFHCQMAKEGGDFTIEDVCRAISEKLINRHPHVFGNVDAKTPEIVLENWEKIKKEEKGRKGKGSLSSVPKFLPALLRAFRITEKASRLGFDWSRITEVEEKMKEEWNELQEAIKENNKKNIIEELGDYLFAVVNLARFLKVDPEDALQLSNSKFLRRFAEVEKMADKRGGLHGMSLDEMESIWNEIKKKEKLIKK